MSSIYWIYIIICIIMVTLENNLVQVKGKDIYTTSKIIADNLDVKHADLLRTIEKLIVKNIAREQPVLSQKFIETKFRNKMNKEYSWYLLNEQAFIKTIMQLWQYEKADEIQNQFITAFWKMKEALNNQSNNTWLNARNNTKETRKLETDVIKELTEYAERESWYKLSYPLYSTYTQMTNKHLQFIVDVEKWKPIRQLASITELWFITVVDDRCKKAIQEGIRRRYPYKEIYRYAKEEVSKLVDSLDFKPKTLV